MTQGSMSGKRIFATMAALLPLLLWSSASSAQAKRGLLDRLTLYPSTQPVQNISHERMILASGIEAWVYRRPVENARKIVLIHFIGNASRAEVESPGPGMLRLFPNDFDIEAWSVNYAGYGGSSGEATLRSFLPTAIEFYDTIKKLYPRAYILTSGTSIGTLAATALAVNRPVAGLLLRNPVPLRELILGRYGWWNLWIGAGPISTEVPKELDTIENAAKVASPVFVLSSEKDEMIPPEYQQKIISNFISPRVIVMPAIGHNDPIPSSIFSKIRIELDGFCSRYRR